MNSTAVPVSGDWVMEELTSEWEVFRIGGRRGRVFSQEETASLVVHENSRRSGGLYGVETGI